MHKIFSLPSAVSVSHQFFNSSTFKPRLNALPIHLCESIGKKSAAIQGLWQQRGYFKIFSQSLVGFETPYLQASFVRFFSKTSLCWKTRMGQQPQCLRLRNREAVHLGSLIEYIKQEGCSANRILLPQQGLTRENMTELLLAIGMKSPQLVSISIANSEAPIWADGIVRREARLETLQKIEQEVKQKAQHIRSYSILKVDLGNESYLVQLAAMIVELQRDYGITLELRSA